ncbi:MAG TPA: ABC transporter permease [Actinospica sp.]|jgi:peptide/nickel transport system permease protein|nr:ABC transporter permease [Actinospica sp.]
MTAYLIRRSLQALATLFLVTIFTFLLLHLLPGGAVRGLLGTHATPAAVKLLTHEMGLDQPLPVQYVKWLGNVLHGDFGYDYANSQSVGSELAGTLGQSAYIVGLSLLFSVIISIPIGLLQAVRRNTALDHSLTVVSFVLWGVPTFLIAFLLQDLFMDQLKWIAPHPEIASFHDAFGSPMAILLPVATLTLTQFASYSRYVRSAVLDELTQEYVRTAIAKGASRRRMLYGHVLRNAMIPMITLIGLSLPALVGGAVIIENVFNIDGIGLLTTQAALQNNFGVTLAATLIAGLLTVLGSLLADLSYAALDPRVRLD